MLPANKEKLLIIVDWYTPGYKAGGPIRSCVNLAFALQDVYTIHILTADTDHGETEPYDNITPNQWLSEQQPGVEIYYAQKKTLSLKQLKQVIIESNAAYIYLNHLFSPYFVVYPLWLKFRGKIKNKVIVCPRGALYDSALSVKPLKKKIFLFLFRILGIHKKVRFHATNEREEKAILHYFPGSEIVIADNLPNPNQPAFISCKKDTGIIKCLFISRIVPIKNLLYLLNALQKSTVVVDLTIIGPVENEAYWEDCKKAINSLPTNIKVEYLGTKKNEELFSIIQQHHLFILPTTGENFGHAIFEALLAGRPVLISDQTPWLKLEEKKAGWDLPLSSPSSFTEKIEIAAVWNQEQFDEQAQAAWLYAQNFIKAPELKHQYTQLFS